MANESKNDPIQPFAKRTLDAKSTRQLEKAVADFVKWQRARNRKLARLYPAPPPNKQCKTAVLSGMLLSNGAGLRPGDFVAYFKYGLERAYVWTHTANEYSALTVTVDYLGVKGSRGWKTLATCLSIAATLSKAFEHIYECRYYWMYRFRRSASFDEQEHYDSDPLVLKEANQGYAHDLHFVADLAPLLELLLRDDKFFQAAQQFLASVSNHWFCIECELGAFVHHPNHEPEPWEAVYILPRLDIALVQACRAVETLVGQPGKNRQRVVARWSSALALNPHDTFTKVGKSYLDFFYDLYDDRNPAAHGRADIPFSLRRKIAIYAQCLAWKVLSGYVEKNARELELAQRELRFNKALLARDRPGYPTKMTDRGYEAVRFYPAKRTSRGPH